MNNIADNFDQILEFARNYGLPLTKKRAVLREYLQVRILEIIYQERVSKNLFFVGGTALRFLRDLDRFSEDLDFDTLNITSSQIDSLLRKVHNQLAKENIAVDFYRNVTPKKIHYELRFKDLLYQLGMSRNHEEKLIVKFDFESFWQSLEREVILLNRYGHLINVVTLPLNQVLVQKLWAYINRKQTLPRDLYDLVWLVAQQAKPDFRFMKTNHLPANLLDQTKSKFVKEKSQIKTLKAKLAPFLINEKNVDKLDFFLQTIELCRG